MKEKLAKGNPSASDRAQELEQLKRTGVGAVSCLV